MKKWLLGLVLLTVVALTAACGNDDEDKGAVSADPAAPSLQVLSDDNVGEYLADDKGMTLYYFKNDVEGKSNCEGECLANWPIMKAGDYEVPEGFDKSDFGKITREDNGEEQLTYKGFPLYYFVKDQAQGDINGEGVKDVWFVVNLDTTFD